MVALGRRRQCLQNNVRNLAAPVQKRAKDQSLRKWERKKKQEEDYLEPKAGLRSNSCPYGLWKLLRGNGPLITETVIFCLVYYMSHEGYMYTYIPLIYSNTSEIIRIVANNDTKVKD